VAGAPFAALEAVAAAVTAVPSGGTAFGVFRYLAADPEFVALPEPQVIFNYLGQQAPPASGLLRWLDAPTGEARSPLAVRRALLEILAVVADGTLRVQWSYSPDVHDPACIASLALTFEQALEAIVLRAVAEDVDELQVGAVPTEPTTDTEKKVAAIWSEVLKLGFVGVDDDFFDLGGDSVFMIQIVSRLRRAFGFRVPLRAMFDLSTVRLIAERIDAVAAGTASF
jgi:non-ribosomal peptide synthase protein (TIGR01720 family)